VMSARPAVLTAVTWAGASAAVAAAGALGLSFVVAGRPVRLARAVRRIETIVPASFAGLVARFAEKFAIGLGAIRRPGRLFGALAWSIPLWLSIAAGIWTVTMAFGLRIPFTGTFLLLSVLTIGVAVPTPGAVGGFDEAFRIGATAFFGVPDAAAVGAALVLHVLSIGPALLLGTCFAARAGLNMSGMRQLAHTREDAA
jgi:glycosyltransferase 2 family protein